MVQSHSRASASDPVVQLAVLPATIALVPRIIPSSTDFCCKPGESATQLAQSHVLGIQRSSYVEHEYRLIL